MLKQTFAHPGLLWLLLLLPALVVLLYWSEGRRRRALVRLGSTRALAVELMQSRKRRRRAAFFLVPGLLSLGVGLAGPQWGRDWGQSAAPGRDLVVVLDCSRSMLAETPSRLERAQSALIDLVEQVRKRGGHRLGLVLFAGRPRLVCPLTQDYDHFRETLEQIPLAPYDPDLAPSANEDSGTRIGMGLYEGFRSFDEHSRGVVDVLLLSDGDDPAEDGEWRFGLNGAQTLEVPIFTVGIGDPNLESSILIQGKPLEKNGTVVKSRLEEGVLRELAQRTGGEYIDARTQSLPLGTIYLDHIATLPERKESVDALPVYQQRYALFLLPALLFLAMGFAVGTRR